MNGILSSDSRAADLVERYESHVSDIYPISQQHVMAMQFPVLLKWLKENEPEQYKRIGYVLSNKDFIRYCLTGRILEERGDASGNNLVNLQTGSYDDRLFKFFGIEEMAQAMPQLVDATDQCGTITAEASAHTGLAAGTPVYAGMFDIDACAVATGVLDDKSFSVTAGTWNINVFPSTIPAPQEVGCMNSIFPDGSALVEASSPTSAGNLDYILRMVLGESGKKIDYGELEGMLADSDARFTDVLFYPFLYGSNAKIDAEGCFIGVRSSTTRDQLIRSVYEGVAFAHRQHMEQLLKVLGHKPKSVRISGGASNSQQWVQMFADIWGIPVETVSGDELGGLGGAMCSAVGSGTYKDFNDAFQHMSNVNHRFEPNTESAAIYDRKYAAYEAVMSGLNSVWTLLRTMQDFLER